MPGVVHVVTTDAFAGVERYVCDTASETATRGWDVTVIGGCRDRMLKELGPDIRWLRGGTVPEALGSLARVGRSDVCHAHMTYAEAVAVALRFRHRAPIVSTRHFAAERGSSRLGTLLAPWIEARLDRQIAVSEFVARRLERAPDAVIRNGARGGPARWSSNSRVVLVLQRLEPEKETIVALRAWQASRFGDEGWSLRIVGDGSERSILEAWCKSNRISGVAFAGWSERVEEELAHAGILLAPSRHDSFGFVVVDAMFSGVPAVACASGGHLRDARTRTACCDVRARRCRWRGSGSSGRCCPEPRASRRLERNDSSRIRLSRSRAMSIDSLRSIE